MGRRIIRYIAVALLLAAAWLYHVACCDRIRVDAASQEVPICLPVDLSAPGTYRGTFRKSFGRNHADFLRLEASPPFSSKEDLRKAVAGLSAVILVGDGASGPWQRVVKSDDWDFERWTPGEPVTIVIAVYSVGDHDLCVRVDQPARGLAGRPHCLMGGYLMCGMEWMPSDVLFIGAAICLVVGTALYVAALLIRPRRASACAESGAGSIADTAGPAEG
jgi:hypothetical protein